MATADPNRLYKVLGVERTATAREIAKTFKKKAAKSHPDKFQGEDCYAQRLAEFRELTGAHAELKDEVLRKEYDRTGKTGAPAQPLTPPRRFTQQPSRPAKP